MIIKGKKACDWCGKIFRKNDYFEYSDGSCYHKSCAAKVGGKTDLGRNILN